MKKIGILSFLIALFLYSSAGAQIKIDGVFFDWEYGVQLDAAPNAQELTFENGDSDTPDAANTSYWADLDIEDVFAADDADFIYLRIKMNSIANVLNIPNDTSYHGGAAIAAYISVDPGAGDTTGLTWGWWGSGYDYFVQVYPEDTATVANTLFQQLVWEHKQAGNGWDFEPRDTVIGAKVAWNFSNNDVEMAIPKSLLLNPLHLPDFVTPDSIAIMIYAGENNAPWRADYASNVGVAGFKFALTKPGPVAIDGVFFDWDPSTQLDVAPNAEELTFANGDSDTPDASNTSYWADLDIDDLYVTDDANSVFVRIKMNSIANVMNIASDTSYHGGAAIAAYISVDPGEGDTTGLTWGWWGSGYDYFVQVYPEDSAFEASTGFQQALWEHKQAGNGWDYEVADETAGVKVAWNFSNNDVEMSIPKSILFSPKYLPNFVKPEEIAVMIYAGENNAPWRADYASEAGVAGFRFTLDKATSVENGTTSEAPRDYSLMQNYPNPFNPTTKINFTIAKSDNVKLRVYNLLGQQVAELLHETLAAGSYSVDFDASNLSTGVYLYSLESGNINITRKMMLVK